MTAGDRVKQVARWLATRSPMTYLIAGWVVFGLGSYPGYMSFDSTMQLFDVRNGVFTDRHAPMMTGIWSVLEYVASGPLPMLALQSGLFLFGLAAIFRTLLAPRAAALAAVAVLMFPPVYAPMAVIWRDSLMAGALVGAVGAMLQPSPRWRVVGLLLGVLACSCRPEAAFAILPLALALVAYSGWKRIAVAVGVTIALWTSARVADWVLVDKPTYGWSQNLMTMDVVGTLRRARVSDEAKLRTLFEGLPIAATAQLGESMSGSRDALNVWPLVYGSKRIFEPLETDEQEAALRAAWRRVIAEYRGAYFTHRWAMTRGVLGIAVPPSWNPVYDSFGEFSLLEPLHHRASASDWQRGWQAVVRGVAATPLFRPWLYLLLAIAAIALARRDPLIRSVAISGIAYQLGMVVLAPAAEYRFAHWLVAAATIAIAAIIARRRWAAQTP